MPPSRKQLELPVAEVQAAASERRNDLYRVLKMVDGDLHLREFLVWVFNVTEGGSKGVLQKSFEQLAARPYGLCCGETKAKCVCRQAADLGLVIVETNYSIDGAQRPNSYAINWPGVGKILGHPLDHYGERANHPLAPGAETGGRGLNAPTPQAQRDGGGVSMRLRYKEYSPSLPLFNKTNDDDVDKEFSFVEAEKLAMEIFVLLWPQPWVPGFRLPAEDRDFVLAVSIMAIRDFDRFWLVESAKITKMRKPNRRVAYFQSTLRNRLIGTFSDSDSLNDVWGKSFGSAIRAVKKHFLEFPEEPAAIAVDRENFTMTEKPSTPEQVASVLESTQAARKALRTGSIQV